jgi:hypothetical protein
MSNEQRKPVWPWIAALLVGLPVLYVASFGPACWWFSRSENRYPVLSGALRPLPFAPRIYFPIGWMNAHGPKFIAKPIEWYATLGTPYVGVRKEWGQEIGVVLQREPIFFEP